MSDKIVNQIVLKTVVEAKLATITPRDGETIIVKRAGGGAYFRVGNGTTAGGIDPLAHIMTILNSPDVNLDTLVEIVTYIKSIRADLTAIAPKWSVITGKPTTLGGYGITDATPSTHIGSGAAAHAVATTAVAGFMTAADKTKLNGVATGANKYAHPASHPPAIITQDANNRFMTDVERTKLAGVAASANNYAHPASHPASIITQDASKRFVTDAEKTAWNAKQSAFTAIVASPIV